MKRSVLIIESAEVIYKGLQTIICDSTNIQVLQQIDSCNNIESRIALLKPDIIIINPALANTDFYNCAVSIPKIALVYQYHKPEQLSKFDFVIDIHDSANKIARTITSANTIEQNNESNDSTELSDREKDVLILIAKGLISKEIADSLNISIHTVISHRKNITRKTGIKSIAGLVAYALLNNLIDSNELE